MAERSRLARVGDAVRRASEGTAGRHSPRLASGGKAASRGCAETHGAGTNRSSLLSVRGVWTAPPAEATVAGAAAVFSDVPATIEAMAGAGCPFANTDYESFRRAMRIALGLPPDTTKNWASALRERHAWSKVAERIVRAIASVSREDSHRHA